MAYIPIFVQTSLLIAHVEPQVREQQHQQQMPVQVNLCFNAIDLKLCLYIRTNIYLSKKLGSQVSDSTIKSDAKSLAFTFVRRYRTLKNRCGKNFDLKSVKIIINMSSRYQLIPRQSQVLWKNTFQLIHVRHRISFSQWQFLINLFYSSS